jgi:hypothetical protein
VDQPRLVPLVDVWRELRELANAPDLVEWLHLGSDDVEGHQAVEQVKRTWAPWPSHLRWVFVTTINHIVQAEHAKEAWKHRDPATHRRYRDLARSAIRAATLAKQIATQFPLPWDENTGRFLALLVEWAVSGLHETSHVDKDLATSLAAAMIEQFRDNLEAEGHRMPFELIARVATLAAGRSEPFDESTLRRYGRDISLTLPAAKLWKQHFSLMVEIARLAPSAQDSRLFREAMHTFLQPPRHH